MTASCSAPDCGGAHYARGWCVTHYRRWQRGGDACTDRPVRPRTGDGYRAALLRLRSARGQAVTRQCADCDGPAATWSYGGGDPDERTDTTRGTPYSLDPTRYRPRCHSCHRRATGQGGRTVEIDTDRVTGLYRAGASVRGIAAHLGTTPTVITRVLRERGVPMRPAGRPQRTPYRSTNTN